MIDWLTGLIKGAAAMVAAFFSGWFAKEKHDDKERLKIEKKRDKIDAAPAAGRDDILKRMRDNGL